MNESDARPDRLDELVWEFAERCRRGEHPSLAEYAARHADVAARIREQFPGLVVIEELTGATCPHIQGAVADDAVPRQLGEYRILREVARGGMGVVYEAIQESLGRHVALKVLPFQPLADANHLERFRREARAAARLHHTNIVPVFGVGEHAGVHYFAMQFIHGQSIHHVLHDLKRQRPTQVGPPLEPAAPPPLVREKTCRADGSVSLAWGLLTGRFPERDEKAGERPADEAPPPAGPPAPSFGGPSTSGAVGSSDRSDLGVQSETQYFRSVARVGLQVAEALAHAHQHGILHRDIKPSNLLLDTSGTVWITDFGLAKAEGTDDLTSPGDLVGTLRYMAPERFQGRADPRSDVFSLGLTLYEMVTLQPAFHARQRAQLIEHLLRQEPPRPRQLDRHVPGDLETIILKAITKEPARRYQSATELAEDLRRFLSNRPVQARRSGWPEHLRRWCGRNPAVAVLVAFVITLLVAVVIVALLDATNLRREQNATCRQLDLTRQAERKAAGRLYRSLVEQARASRMSRRIGQRFQTLKALAEAAQMARDMNLPEQDFLELRSEAIACLALPDMRVASEWDGWPAGSLTLDFDGDLKHYARVDRQGVVSIRRVDDDAERGRLPGFGPGNYGPTEAYPHFSPDGRSFLLWRGGRVKVWKLAGPRPLHVLDELTGVVALTFSPDGRRLATGAEDGSIRLYDLASGRQVGQLVAGPRARYLAFHPCGLQLAISHATGVQIRDLATGGVRADLSLPTGAGKMAWNPNGRTLAAVCGGRAIQIWDVATGKPVTRLEGPRADGTFFAFSRAGDLLASNGWDEVLRLWDPRTGQQLFSTPAHMRCLRFSPDDRLLAADSDGNHLRLWEVVPACGYRMLVRDPVLGQGEYGSCATSPRDRLLAAAMADGVGLWDASSGIPLTFLPLGRHTAVHFESSGALLTNGQAGLLRWPVRDDAAAPGSVRIGPPQRLPLLAGEQAAISRNGRVVASAQGWGGLVWDRDVPGSPIPLSPHEDARYIEISPDGRRVATGSHWGTKVKIWEARTGKLVRELPVEAGSMVRYSPDGRWLATSGGGCQLWAVDSWQKHLHIGGGGALAFAPDSKLLAAEARHGVVRLIDPVTGREYARLEDPSQDRAIALCFYSDGTQLVVSSERSSIHIWDLRALREQLASMGLDWDLPAYPPPYPAGKKLLQVRVELGEAAALIQAQACEQQGRGYFKAAQWAKAIAAYSKAVDLDPRGACAQNNLGWLLATCPESKFRNPGRAVGAATRAVELTPQEGNAWNTLGVARYRARDWEGAIAALEKSDNLLGGKEFSYNGFFLALAHWQRGHKEQARTCYDRAVRWMEQNSPQHEELRRFRAEAAALLQVNPSKD